MFDRPEIGGTRADQLPKLRRKMERGMKTQETGDLLDRFVGVEQKIAGALNAHGHLILLGRHAGLLAKQAPEIGVADTEFLGEMFDRKRLTATLHQNHPRTIDKPAGYVAVDIGGPA